MDTGLLFWAKSKMKNIMFYGSGSQRELRFTKKVDFHLWQQLTRWGSVFFLGPVNKALWTWQPHPLPLGSRVNSRQVLLVHVRPCRLMKRMKCIVYWRSWDRIKKRREFINRKISRRRQRRRLWAEGWRQSKTLNMNNLTNSINSSSSPALVLFLCLPSWWAIIKQ